MFLLHNIDKTNNEWHIYNNIKKMIAIVTVSHGYFRNVQQGLEFYDYSGNA